MVRLILILVLATVGYVVFHQLWSELETTLSQVFAWLFP